MDKIKLAFKKENFSDFIDKLKDLTNLGDNIKMDIDNEHIFVFSTLGQTMMLGFKNYLLKTNDYLMYKEEIEKPISIVIVNAKRFLKNLSFLENQDNIKFDIIVKPTHRETDYTETRAFQLISGKLKINWIAGEDHNMGQSVGFITKDFINENLNIRNRDWSFTVKTDELKKTIQLANNNPIDIVDIKVSGGDVSFSQTAAWELEMGKTEKNMASFVFNKRFFKCINMDEDEITFHLFERFILLQDNNSNLMLSYEQDFSDTDI